MLQSPVYLVRHGKQERVGGEERLSDKGRHEDAPNARARLLSRGVGHDALLLSSDYPRAIQTAQIIGEGIGAQVVPSKRIGESANRAKGIRSLDDFLSKALAEAGLEQRESGLVVVTHAPMLAIALRRYEEDAVESIGYGQVVDYEPGSWQNPNFDESQEYIIEQSME